MIDTVESVKILNLLTSVIEIAKVRGIPVVDIKGHDVEDVVKLAKTLSGIEVGEVTSTNIPNQKVFPILEYIPNYSSKSSYIRWGFEVFVTP